MKSCLLLLTIAFATPFVRAQKPTDEAVFHQQLRELKSIYETAINTGNLAPLEPFFDAKSSGVTIDNQTFHSFAELKAIYDKFHTDFPGVVYRVTMTAEPSLLAGDLAVARGISEEYVKTAAGEFTYAGTWTAVLRYTDGGWKLVRSQMTMDPFRNPVVKFFQKRTRLTYGSIALAIGVIAGFLIGRLSLRRQQVRA
jgi:hypothetical protein